MNKEQLKQRIEAMPLFELRNVAVGAPLKDESYEYQWERTAEHRAVCPVGTQTPLAIVSPEYVLVQFKDCYSPIISADDFLVQDARLQYYDGYGIMTVFPEGNDFVIDDDTKIGIAVHNSVNKKSGLSIKFIVDSRGRTLTIPKKIASFRRIHVGKVQQATKDYIEVANKVRASWQTIVMRFTQWKLAPEDMDELYKSFSLGERIQEKIAKELPANPSFWDFAMVTFDELSKIKYTSDIHKQRTLDEFCEAIFVSELVAKLGGV